MALKFASGSRIVSARKYGAGNVNDTFLVTLAAGADDCFILQRLNPEVFPVPELVMQNLVVVARHLGDCRGRDGDNSGRRWEVPRVLPDEGSLNFVIDAAGFCWRALSFIPASRTLDTIANLEHALEVGYALGRFHSSVSDLNTAQLTDPLPGFHILPRYLRHYDQVRADWSGTATPEVRHCSRFIEARRHGAAMLEEAKACGRLQVRPIHGDPKINNIMLDVASGQAVGMIDLDTVAPGLVHYDIGDCLRSGCNLAGEETEAWREVRFEPDLARAILTGYLSQTRGFLTPHDYDYFYPAIRLLAFELGLRFFTDYLAGNVYFKVRHPDHNLRRALVQFALTASIEAQEEKITRLLREL